MRFARSIAPVVAGWWLGIGLGCTMDLAHRIACGDGYVDPEAGEECDPQVPSSYEKACIGEHGGGVGGCDATTCTLLVNKVQCAFCGDGVVNLHPGQSREVETSGTHGDDDTTAGESSGSGGDLEECDEDDFDGALCPDGVTPLKCRGCKVVDDHCPTYCGDGERNGREECDPDPKDITTEMQKCAPDKLGFGGVQSPHFASHVYGSGTATCAYETCEWERGGCSYCGNGEIDHGLLIDDDPRIEQEPEICDGLDILETTVVDELFPACAEISSTLRPNVRCADDCGGLVLAPDQPPCCTRVTAICPGPDDPYQCCSAYLHADDILPFTPCTPGSDVLPSYCL